MQILRAARFAHRRGIIHRDFKPQNVIVDDEGRAKVTDFGIARAGASDMTQTGSILGTAQYLSPEQAQGHAVGARSDLYSIGIILYELLTGRVPFEADSAVTIALKQVSEAPIAAEPSINPRVTPELESVVLRALAKEPRERFADADEFIAALEAAASRIPSPRAIAAAEAAAAALPAAAAVGGGGVMAPPPPPPPQPPPRAPSDPPTGVYPGAAVREERREPRRRGRRPPAPRAAQALAVDRARRAARCSGSSCCSCRVLAPKRVAVPNVVGALDLRRATSGCRARASRSRPCATTPTSRATPSSARTRPAARPPTRARACTITVSEGPADRRRARRRRQGRDCEARKTLTDAGFEVRGDEVAVRQRARSTASSRRIADGGSRQARPARS